MRCRLGTYVQQASDNTSAARSDRRSQAPRASRLAIDPRPPGRWEKMAARELAGNPSTQLAAGTSGVRNYFLARNLSGEIVVWGSVDPRLSDATHGPLLPPSWRTLYELTKLDDALIRDCGGGAGRYHRLDRASWSRKASGGIPMSPSLADVLVAVIMWAILIFAAVILIRAIFRTARWLWKKLS
jgi:hypothetical protein